MTLPARLLTALMAALLVPAMLLAAPDPGEPSDPDAGKKQAGKEDAAEGAPPLGPPGIVVTIPRTRNPLPPEIVQMMRLRLLEQAGFSAEAGLGTKHGAKTGDSVAGPSGEDAFASPDH